MTRDTKPMSLEEIAKALGYSEDRSYSDTEPMSQAEILAALAAHEGRDDTRMPPCAACSDRAQRLDENDEVPDRGEQVCEWCHNSGGMTADERHRYFEERDGQA